MHLALRRNLYIYMYIYMYIMHNNFKLDFSVTLCVNCIAIAIDL